MLRVNHDKRFYDTSSLLKAGEKLFEKKEHFMISSITLNELEKIKTSSTKDIDIKYSARRILHLLENYPDLYQIVIHNKENEKAIEYKGIDINNDTKILSDAYASNEKDDIIFVTNDLSLKHIANLFFGNGMIESFKEEDDYTGYLEIFDTNERLFEFYQDSSINHFGLNIGQYLIIKDKENKKPVDIRVWTGTEHRYLRYEDFDSTWFGTIRPYKEDTLQKLAFDSLANNQITMLKGPPGSGKTILALGYLMDRLEHNQIDKIVIFCNTIATANSAKLGFYPGTRDEKLLDSQIGNMLVSKFGSIDAIQRLINSEVLVLLPFSDLRGYDTNGMKAGVYISEAQNLDRALIKLALQRVGEDCICIIDGDDKAQVDDIHFSGDNNGMRRVSKVYRGYDFYGEVELKNIYRSKISAIAESI